MDLFLGPLVALLAAYPNDNAFLVGDFKAKAMTGGNDLQIPEDETLFPSPRTQAWQF